MANNEFKILILGANGMVGHTVFNYLSDKFPDQVFGTCSRSDSKNQFKFKFSESTKELEKIITDLQNVKFIINCIGELKNGNSKKMKINYTLPALLDKLAEKKKFQLIHISTDDVFSPYSGKVNEKSKPNPENNYALTKLLGETKSKKSITIRTSFLGFDKNKKGLLEYARNSKIINGYDNQIWSGCTTLQFSRFCEYLITGSNFKKLRKRANVVHFVPLGPVSKYSILKSAIKVLNLNTKIYKTKAAESITRVLTSVYLSKKFFSIFNTDVDLSISELYKFENK